MLSNYSLTLNFGPETISFVKQTHSEAMKKVHNSQHLEFLFESPLTSWKLDSGWQKACTWCGLMTHSPQHEVCRECAYMMEDHDHVE